MKEDISGWFSSISEIAPALTGFIFAGLAILLSIQDKELIKNLKKTGQFQNLLKQMLVLIMILLILMLFSLSALIFEEIPLGLNITIFLLSWSVLQLFKVCLELKVIIENI